MNVPVHHNASPVHHTVHHRVHQKGALRCIKVGWLVSCRHCLVGAEWGCWHCECEEDRWDHGEKEEEEEQEQSEQLTEEEEEDVTSDDGSEWEGGFETDTEEDEEQQNDEMMISPEIALPSAKMITPEDATTRTWGGKVLFRT